MTKTSGSLSSLFLLGALTLLCLQRPVGVHGFSASVPDLKQRTVTLPLTSNEREKSSGTLEDKQVLQHAFDYIVETSEFMEYADPTAGSVGNEKPVVIPQEKTLHSSCRIPALGDDVVVDFYLDKDAGRRDSPDNNDQQDQNFVLKVSGASLTDFGWICTKFYGERELFDGLLETDGLRQQVASHLNREPPSTGYTASSAVGCPQENKAQQAFLNNLIDDSHLKQLEEQGYVVLEPRESDDDDVDISSTSDEKTFEVSQQSQEDLSQYLVETTGDVYRKDMVHFLTHPQANEAGLGEHYNMLMSIATFLNTNLSFRKSHDNPIAPATKDEPLTVPRMIQLAQYSHGDYYVAHSDNSYENDTREDEDELVLADDDDTASATAPPRVRNNFRHYTCILYCNDLTESDGGALRLYLNSRDMHNKDAQETCPYVDIIPKNGRLLIFDSCMVHSVQKFLSPTKLRRALTLWILRPNDSGVTGETYY